MTPRFPRITLTVDGAVHPIDQVTKQLHKLVNVIKIRDMEPGDTIAREMALFKVSARSRARSNHAIRRDLPREDRRRLAALVDDRGDPGAEEVEAFERMIRPHGLIEMVLSEIAIARSKSDS